MPFDHLIVVMMENHSFDNLLGALSQPPGRRRPDVRQRRTRRTPTRARPHTPADGDVVPVPEHRSGQERDAELEGDARADQRRRDGRIRAHRPARASRWATTPPEVLPFAYSLASTFTLANRWFCSMPGPTYPNRRFLLAGTAYGATVTAPETLFDPPPPHGTIFDRLSAHNINWCNYFTDMPMTAVIPSIILKHADHLAPISKFFHDCQAGTLPGGQLRRPGARVPSPSRPPAERPCRRSRKDAEGARRRLPGRRPRPRPRRTRRTCTTARRGRTASSRPCCSRRSGAHAADLHLRRARRLLRPRPAAAAIPPDDDRRPSCQPGDPPGGYDMYGPRVPAVVVSPYSKPGRRDRRGPRPHLGAGHDRGEVEPARAHLARRQRQHVMDFLDLRQMAWGTPPVIDAPTKPPGLAAAGGAGG